MLYLCIGFKKTTLIHLNHQHKNPKTPTMKKFNHHLRLLRNPSPSNPSPLPRATLAAPRTPEAYPPIRAHPIRKALETLYQLSTPAILSSEGNLLNSHINSNLTNSPHLTKLPGLKGDIKSPMLFL